MSAHDDDTIDRAALALVNFDQSRLDLPTIATIEDFRRDEDRELYRGFARAALTAAMEGK